MINEHIEVPLDDFLEENVGLIYHVIKKYPTFDQDDLFQEAAIQFIKCYENFDGRGEFSSYAVKSMERAVWRYLRDYRDVVRLPARFMHVQHVAKKNNTENIKELSGLTGFDEQFVSEAMQGKNHVMWLDSPVNDDSEGKERSLFDSIGTHDDYIKTYIKDFLDALTDEERHLIDLRMQGYTQKEISRGLGLHQVTVSRKQRTILRKGKHYFGEG